MSTDKTVVLCCNPHASNVLFSLFPGTMTRQWIPTSCATQQTKHKANECNNTPASVMCRTSILFCSFLLHCICIQRLQLMSLFTQTYHEWADRHPTSYPHFRGHTSERWWTPAACFRKSNQDLWTGPINIWSSLWNHIAVFNRRNGHWYVPLCSNNYIYNFFFKCLQFLWNLRKLQQTINVTSWKTNQYPPPYLNDSYKTHSLFKNVPNILYFWGTICRAVYNSLSWSISLYCSKKRRQPPGQLQCIILIRRLSFFLSQWLSCLVLKWI